MEATGSRERGMATAELAMVSLVVAMLTAVVVWLIGALALLNLCQVSANEVARQEARGDRAAVARAERDAPAGATVTRRHEGGATVVEVGAQARFGGLFPWPVRARAAVLDEGGRR